MKIKKSELKNIIKEEIDSVMFELAPCHNPDTGYFDDCDSGAVYSLSEPAVRKAGWDKGKAKKGIVTAKGKTISKFGMAGTTKGCGRKSVSGEKIPKKYSCSDYSKKYIDEEGHPLVPSIDDSESDRLDKLGYTHHLRALGKGIIRLDEFEEDEKFILLSDLEKVLDEMVCSHSVNEDKASIIMKCKQYGLVNMIDAQQSILKSLNSFSLASSGKLYDKAKA